MAGKGNSRRVAKTGKTGRIYSPVLVLNASYEAISMVPARRALVLYTKGVAVIEHHSNHPIRYGRGTIMLPTVIRLREYRKVPHQTRALSRKNILMRDRYTCQYCLQPLPAGELTLDHVIPRASNGESSWENLVACCFPCNQKKGSHKPEEAGLTLARQPRPFTIHTSRSLMRISGENETDWRQYLFY